MRSPYHRTGARGRQLTTCVTPCSARCATPWGDGTPLIAPGADGMGSVELANVLLYSSLINQTVELPMDSAAWEKKLNQLIAESRHEKKVVQNTAEDFTKSFNR